MSRAPAIVEERRGDGPRGARTSQGLVIVLLTTAAAVGGSVACTHPDSSAPTPGSPSPDHAAPDAPTVQSKARATSDHASLRGVELGVDSWEWIEGGIRVRIEVENRGPGIGLAPESPTAAAVLSDPSGRSVHPLAGSESLLDRLAAEGLPPGDTLAAVLDFPDPGGEPPWTLRVPPFGPLELSARARPAGASAAAPETRPTSASTQAGTEKQRPEPAPSPAEARERQIRELLDRQARSLLRKEEGPYLDTIHPRIRDREHLYFQWSRQVPFSEVGLELVSLAPRGPAGAPLVALVEMTVRLDEQPADNPFVYRLTYELEVPEGGLEGSLGGRLRVSAIRQDPQRPLFWHQPSLALHRTHHFLLYVWPRPARDVLDTARDAEAAYMSILQQGLPLAPRYVAHLVTDETLFRRVVGSPLAVGGAVSRQVMDGGSTRVDSRSFYLNGPLLAPFRIDRPDQDERRVTIAHELVHLALSPWTRHRTPPWLVEGAAVYYSGRLDFESNRILVRSGLEGISLSRLTMANVLGEHATPDRRERAAFEYLYAGNLVAHLVRQFGNDRFLSFYRSFAAVETGDDTTGDRSDAAAALDLTEKELAEHFRLSLATLDQQVKTSMRLRFR